MIKLHEGGLISLKEFFNASVDDIVNIDGFQKKGAERIVKNIKKAITNAPLHEIMAASSFFPGFGKKRLVLITKEIPDLEKIDSEDQLEDIKTQILAIKGFKKLADVFVEKLLEFNAWLADHPEITLAGGDEDVQSDDEAEPAEDNWVAEDGDEKTSPASGLAEQTIVFSGTRADAPLQRKIERAGGRVT